MRIYQDKLGIYTESDLKSQQETLEDPLLARLGIGKQPELEQLNKKDFNYLLPLLVAYKHKLSMLDKHLTERYKQVVRKNNDLENQLEIKQKLITQIDNKQQEALNIAGSIDPLNADYSSMGTRLSPRLHLADRPRPPDQHAQRLQPKSHRPARRPLQRRELTH